MASDVADLPPTFTTRTALSFGLHPRDLYRLRDEGDLVELSRGVFRRADVPPAALPDLLAVSYRVPVGIVCCVSALVVHDLTDEIPAAVQTAIPRQHTPPKITYPPADFLRFAVDTFDVGMAFTEAAPGEEIRIYNAERTVVDLMRLRHRLGEPLAYGALRRYLRRHDARPGELLTMARALDVYHPVRTALDINFGGSRNI